MDKFIRNSLTIVTAAYCLIYNGHDGGTFASISDSYGHYPYLHCKLTNAIFLYKEKTFYYDDHKDNEVKCTVNKKIWPIEYTESVENLKNRNGCDRIFKKGFAFTIYYWAGTSNYYHLTYDMLIPLYKQIYHEQDSNLEPNATIFMPTVESTRLNKLDWNTPAFKDMQKFWANMAKFIAEDSMFKPLDQSFLDVQQNLCFEEIYFGTSKAEYDNPKLIQSFVNYVKERMGIQENTLLNHRLAIVSRKGRRRILNEREVVESLQSLIPTDLIEFSGKSYMEQVKLMQNYTIMAAMNGAGLMNALYLPKNGVAIQMAPYNTGLNVKQYGTLLKSRGPYLEWHNTYSNMTEEFAGDNFNNRPNTIVHIEEFKAKIEAAIKLYDQHIREHNQRTEL